MKINKEALVDLPVFERALVLASIYHAGAIDKGGNHYILHPMAVALSLDTDEERITAILHDIVEDTVITFKNLAELGFSDKVVKAIESVTRRENESYMDFIRRCKCNEIGRKVKLKDIENNLDISRIPNPTEKDLDRLNKYKKAKKILES